MTSLGRRPAPVPIGVSAAVAVAVSWVLLLAMTRNGITVGRDSKSYLDLAGDLRAGRWFGDADFETARHFPPGLGLSIAFVSLTGLSLTGAALVVNLLSWAATIVGVTVLANDPDTPAPWPNLWAIQLFIATSGVMLTLHGEVLSEAPFIAVCVWFLVVAERPDAPTPRSLASLVVLGAAAIAFRYLGVALVGAGCLSLLARRGTPVRRVLVAAVPALGVLPIVVWYLGVGATEHGSALDVPPGSFAASDVGNTFGALGSVFGGGVPYSERRPVVAAAVGGPARAALIVLGSVVVVAAVVVSLRWLRRKLATESGTVASILDTLVVRRSATTLAFIVLTTAITVVWRWSTGYFVLARYWIPVVIVATPLVARLSPSLVPSRDDRTLVRWLPAVVVAGIVATNVIVSATLVLDA